MTATDCSDLEHGVFSQSPVPMMVEDEQGRVCWANHALSELIGLPNSQLLGHNRESVPSPNHRVLFDETPLIHLEGRGVPDRWLKRESRSGNGSGDKRRYIYFQDVTREMLLEKTITHLQLQLDNLSTTDALTGLPNQRAMRQQLEMQVSRSRRYRNNLSLVLVEAKIVAEKELAAGAVDTALRETSRYLRDRLRWVDQIARWGDNRFLIILPETADGDARDLATKLSGESGEIALPEVFEGHNVQLLTSCASWTKGDDARTMLERAANELETAD